MKWDYETAFVTLFKEVFEGVPEGQDYTLFVQGKEGLFNVFESLSAQQASQPPAPNSSTIFAHMFHAKYYISLFNRDARGEEFESDWDGSWRVQVGTDSEWQELGKEMRKEFKEVLSHVSDKSRGNDEDVNVALYQLAQLAHAAFHLGAVRALMKVI